jgi:galactokinase
MDLCARVNQAFEEHFKSSPEVIVRAPGRVNLIGEHTDYNDGFVLPMAIDRAVWIALRPRSDRQVSVRSLDFDQERAFSLKGFTNDNEGWIEYVKGVAWAMQAEGFDLHGWEGVMCGDVPVGAGLSSSAATEMVTGRAFAVVSGLAWHPARMALLGQKAENKWVGVNCGIMDQMVSAAAKEGHALFLDCRSLVTEHIPLPPNVAVIVLDTSTRRGLVDSAYNERRAQCEAAARHFGVRALRDVSSEVFAEKSRGLDDVTLRRARHIVTEDERVLAAISAMRSGEVVELGALLVASHESLRDDFEVTNEALNQIVECALRQNGCYGARMTGAGFGGCALALVATDAVEAFVTSVAEAYRQLSGLQAAIYVCEAAQGASVV